MRVRPEQLLRDFAHVDSVDMDGLGSWFSAATLYSNCSIAPLRYSNFQMRSYFCLSIYIAAAGLVSCVDDSELETHRTGQTDGGAVTCEPGQRSTYFTEFGPCQDHDCGLGTTAMAVCPDDGRWAECRCLPVASPSPSGGSGGTTDTAPRAGSGAKAFPGGGTGGSVSPDSAPVAPTDPYVSSEVVAVGFDKYDDANPKPLLLFKGGYASFRLDVIRDSLDVGADMNQHPKQWYRWRRVATRLERTLSESEEWKALSFDYEATALAKGTKVSGLFERIVRATSSNRVSLSRHRYRFQDDGTFEFCVATAAITDSSPSPDQQEPARKNGTYDINKYKIQLASTAGGTETKVFIYDLKQPERFWSEDGLYSTTSESSTDICVDSSAKP